MYTAITLAQLQADMVDLYDESVFWTEEESRLAINEALRDWNLLTGRWRRRLTLTAVPAQTEYSLGATLIYGARVTVAGSPLHPTSLIELDLGRPSWRGETTASGNGAPSAPTLWAPVSLQRIAIWPATTYNPPLVVDGVAATPILVTAADTVDLGEELHDPLLGYAIHVVAFKEAGPRWRATLPYYFGFLQLAAEDNELLKASQAYRRYAGLDRRKDMTPTRVGPTMIDELGQPPRQGGQ